MPPVSTSIPRQFDRSNRPHTTYHPFNKWEEQLIVKVRRQLKLSLDDLVEVVKIRAMLRPKYEKRGGKRFWKVRKDRLKRKECRICWLKFKIALYYNNF